VKLVPHVAEPAIGRRFALRRSVEIVEFFGWFHTLFTHFLWRYMAQHVPTLAG
jgi:hypothetical protein